MENDTWQIIVFIGCLICSAFFSASETALMSLSKIRIRNMVEEGIGGAKLIDKLLKNPGKLLSSILVGNNIVNIGASSLATSIAINLFGDKGVGIATGIVTLLVLIFGEITPKSLANTYAENIALVVVRPIYVISVVLTPVTAIFSAIANFFIKLFGGENTEKAFVTEEEIKTMVDMSHEDGVLEGKEKEMIHNIFEFNDTVVKEIIIPRTDMVSIDKDLSFSEIVEVFKKEQFSRIPVYDEQIDNIIGILHMKDLFFVDIEKEEFDINKYLRPALFTYEYKKIDELFAEMQKNRSAIAIIMNEYGGVSGLVTMEDLIEEIVGEIEDEYDEIVEGIKVIEDYEYLADGKVSIEEIKEVIGIDIQSDEFDSIGGFVIGLLGTIPKVGATAEYSNIKFIVTEVKNYRVKKLKIVV